MEQTETGQVKCAHAEHRKTQTTSTLQTSYHKTRHRWGSKVKQGMLVGVRGAGQG